MYKIEFEDGSIFEDENPLNSKWNKMPNKNIVSLTYNLFGIKTIFKGFEEYNHIIERASILNLKTNKKTKRIVKIIIMGKWGNKVYETIYDLIKQKVEQRIEIKGQEYIIREHKISNPIKKFGIPTTGWKTGKINIYTPPKMQSY